MDKSKIETILILFGALFAVILIIGSVFCINFAAANLIDALTPENVGKSEMTKFDFDGFKKLDLGEQN